MHVRKSSKRFVTKAATRARVALLMVSLAAAGLTAGCLAARADDDAVIDKIATYQGADRAKILEEGARKEGTLTFYTAMVVDQAIRPLVAGFEKRYPYIKVQFVREDPPQNLQRLLAEVRAKRFVIDVDENVGLEAPARAAGINRPFWSPALADYPKKYLSPEGLWAPTRLSYVGVSYNTNLVRPGEVPKTYDDLLNPKWKGKLAWANTFSGAMMTITAFRNFMGEAKAEQFLEKLSKQDVVPLAASSRAVLDRVIAGEYAMSLDSFLHHAILSAEKGAPVKPAPIDPVLTFFNTVMLMKHAPHPHASMLFIDYLLSTDGQATLRDAQYFPSNPKVKPLADLGVIVPANVGMKENFLPSEQITAEFAKSKELYQRFFAK
jgi:iron(III) transport system substrate-binding protein